jgi:hypothetical protein
VYGLHVSRNYIVKVSFESWQVLPFKQTPQAHCKKISRQTVQSM